jgi:hypothetical protein
VNSYAGTRVRGRERERESERLFEYINMNEIKVIKWEN